MDQLSILPEDRVGQLSNGSKHAVGGILIILFSGSMGHKCCRVIVEKQVARGELLILSRTRFSENGPKGGLGGKSPKVVGKLTLWEFDYSSD